MTPDGFIREQLVMNISAYMQYLIERARGFAMCARFLPGVLHVWLRYSISLSQMTGDTRISSKFLSALF